MVNSSAISKSTGFLLAAVCLLLFYGCIKSSSNPPAQSNATLILGKWLLTKQVIRIYNAAGTLVRDTTDAFGIIQPGVNSYQTFNADGSSISLSNVDTTGIYTYTLSGTVLKIYPNLNVNSYQAQNIVSLNETNLELESILTGSDLPAVWGLDPTATYKLVEDDYFTRIEAP